MATVDSYTADHMDAVQSACVVSGLVTGDDLVLTKYDGSTFDAGNVRGPKGDKGDTGIQGIQGPGNATDSQVSTFINTASSASQVAVDARVATTKLASDWNTATTPGRYYNTSKTHAPDANNYEGLVLSDGSGNLTQILWRSGVNTLVTTSQWMRTSIGAAWGPWIQTFGDSGWLTSGVLANGIVGSITGQASRIRNGIAYVMATITLPAITINTSGDIGNQTIGQVTDSRFYPTSPLGAYGSSGSSGRVATYAMGLTGAIALCALGGTSNVAANEGNTFSFVYPVI